MNGWATAAIITWVGMVAALVIVYGWIKAGYRRNEPKRFDERQLQAQGKAYKWGFLTGVFFLLGMVILRIFDHDPDYHFLTILCIVAMLLVFATVAIWKDAYVAIGEKEARLAIYFLVLGIVDVVFSRGDWVNLLAGGAFVYLAGLIWARKEARQEEEGF